MELVYFFGRFHVLALHLPIGIILLAALVDLRFSRETTVAHKRLADFLWGSAAVSAVVTVALGYMHFAEGGFTGPSAGWHRLYGTGVAVVAVAIWLMRKHFDALYAKVRFASTAAAVAGVVVTGHYGGNLTHGSTYLIAYAPQAIRGWMGVEERQSPSASADVLEPYRDIIAPILNERCQSCHNDDKRRGGLSLTTYEVTLAGGDEGVVIRPGDSEASELFRRISLPADHDEFMPAEGKTPLTEEQVELLRWWIDAGAPKDTKLDELSLDDRVRALLTGSSGVSLGAPTPRSTETLQRLREAGFTVRSVSQDDFSLVVALPAQEVPLSDGQQRALIEAAPDIVDLSLHDVHLDHDIIESLVGALSAVRILRLSNAGIDDGDLSLLGRLSTLETLNVYGNPLVTDTSVRTLVALDSLRTAYLWATGLSSEGWQMLAESRPNLEVVGRSVAVSPGSTALSER